MTRDERLALKRVDQKRRRSDAIASGMCAACCIRPHEPDVTQCSTCLESRRQIRHKQERHYPTTQHVATVDRFCVECQCHGMHRDSCRGQST